MKKATSSRLLLCGLLMVPSLQFACKSDPGTSKIASVDAVVSEAPAAAVVGSRVIYFVPSENDWFAGTVKEITSDDKIIVDFDDYKAAPVRSIEDRHIYKDLSPKNRKDLFVKVAGDKTYSAGVNVIAPFNYFPNWQEGIVRDVFANGILLVDRKTYEVPMFGPAKAFSPQVESVNNVTVKNRVIFFSETSKLFMAATVQSLYANGQAYLVSDSPAALYVLDTKKLSPKVDSINSIAAGDQVSFRKSFSISKKKGTVSEVFANGQALVKNESGESDYMDTKDLVKI